MADPAELAGRLVAVPLAALARLRGGKPMHPRGAVFDAILERWGSTPPWGAAWLDDPGADSVLVRLSRGAGLPAPLPDLLGIAVRLAGDPPVDLLLSSTGRGPVGRLVPVPRRNAAVPYSSIMGYRSDGGTLRLAVLPETADFPSEPREMADHIGDVGAMRGATRPDRRSGGNGALVFTLAAARGLGAWRPFGRLMLTAPRAPLDPDVRFDAVLHPPPGLLPDGPMARFRLPAYARARAARSGTVRP